MISVVIPCYKVKAHILAVIAAIGPEVSSIIVVDDCCPEGSGHFVKSNCVDSRVHVVFHEINQGVGAATLTGYREALSFHAQVVVKVDGDGQMDPLLIPIFAKPILEGRADYTKGNRFFNLDALSSMPLLRRVGNAGLSFISKLSSGYWKVMDPTNGFTAISTKIVSHLPHAKIAKRYFFESDMLFRLNVMGAVVEDIPMDARYGDEVSNLSCGKALVEFPGLYANRFFKRILYNYFLRDFSAASIELVLGLLLSIFGMIFGLYNWWSYTHAGISTPTGTIFLAAMPIILGFQLLLAWLTFDVSSSPQSVLHVKLNF